MHSIFIYDSTVDTSTTPYIYYLQCDCSWQVNIYDRLFLAPMQIHAGTIERQRALVIYSHLEDISNRLPTPFVRQLLYRLNLVGSLIAIY